jgi:hypothetical protein
VAAARSQPSAAGLLTGAKTVPPHTVTRRPKPLFLRHLRVIFNINKSENNPLDLPAASVFTSGKKDVRRV